MSVRRGVTRRGFLTVAVSAIVAGVVAGVGSYYAGILSAPVKEVTKTVTSTTTLAPGAPHTTTITLTQPPTTITTTVTKTETVTATGTPKISEEPIKIAVLTNLSGSNAGGGLRAKVIWDAMAKEINDKGGVYLKETGAYHKIQLTYYDCESSPARTAELATKVATEKQTHFIFLRPGPPALTFPAVINVEKVGGIPAIAESPVDELLASVAPAVPGGRFTWVWPFHFSLSELVLENELPFFASVKDKTNGVIGCIFEDDPDGVYIVEELKFLGHLKEFGYQVIYPGRIPPGTKDLTAVITKFKEANVEALYANCMPAIATVFLSQSQILGFKPKILLIDRGITVAGGPEPFGDVAVGTVIQLFWWDSYPYPGNDWIRANWDRISGGLFYCAFEGYAYAWMQAVIKAIETAGSLDKSKINDAMLKLDFQSATGRVKFDPQTHVCKGTTTLGQVLKTPEGKWKINIVWAPKGSEIPTQPLLIPKPWP